MKAAGMSNAGGSEEAVGISAGDQVSVKLWDDLDAQANMPDIIVSILTPLLVRRAQIWPGHRKIPLSAGRGWLEQGALV